MSHCTWPHNCNGQCRGRLDPLKWILPEDRKGASHLRPVLTSQNVSRLRRVIMKSNSPIERLKRKTDHQRGQRTDWFQATSTTTLVSVDLTKLVKAGNKPSDKRRKPKRTQQNNVKFQRFLFISVRNSSQTNDITDQRFRRFLRVVIDGETSMYIEFHDVGW
jgi:hypothetical protein